MVEYLNKINNCNKKLKDSGFINFPDSVIAAFYLKGLPRERYETFIRSIKLKDGVLSTQNIKAKLLLEEKRDKNLHASENTVNHLALKIDRQTYQKKYRHKSGKEGNEMKDNQDDKSTGAKSRIYWCYACGGKNHIAKHCPKLKEEVSSKHKSSENVKRTASIVTRE